MLGEFRRDLRQQAVADQRDFLDLAMVIVNESEMPHHPLEVFPTAELPGMNEEASQGSAPGEVQIDILRQLPEIALRKRPLRLDDHNILIFEYLVSEHGGGKL